MKPSLEQFFQTMDRLFAEPEALPELSPAPPGRVRLYADFVEGHIRAALQKVYPLTVAQLKSGFGPLAAAYYRTRPATHFELNRAAEGFVSFLADRAQALALPPHLLPLARFEWTDFGVYAAPVELPERVEAFTLNPTLTVLQHPFQLCAFVAAAPDARPAAPAAGEETALLWRDPKSLRTTFVAADPRRLLAVKLLIDGVPLEQAAEDSGAPVALLEGALLSAANEGFVLAPAER